jgi:Transposase Tn5 dimerisation domain
LDAHGKEHQLDCQIRFSKVALEGISKPIYVVNLQQIEQFPKKATSNEEQPQPLANWTIITNLKVKYADDAIEVLDIYNHRWRTCEDFHKCLKTGCQIQERQLQSPEALLKTIAMLSLVAIQLLRLRHLSEIQALTPIEELLSEDEIQVAQIVAKQYLKPIDETCCKPNTVLWFVLLMARMGGHQGIKQSGMPGWQTIWKGLYHFQILVDGFIMSKNFLLQKPPTYG